MVGSHRMTNDTEDGRGRDPAGRPQTEITDLARRAALEKMGRYAAYIAPTLLVLLRGGEVSAGKDSLPTDVPCSVGNPDRPEQCNV